MELISTYKTLHYLLLLISVINIKDMLSGSEDQMDLNCLLTKIHYPGINSIFQNYWKQINVTHLMSVSNLVEVFVI